MSGVALLKAGGTGLALLAGGYALAQDQGAMRRGAPVAPEVADPATADAPLPRTYADACGSCHDNNGFGVQVLRDRVGADRSLLHQRRDLPPALIRVAVRNGIGAMPPMSKVEVSDAELDAIVAELVPTPAGEAP